MDKSREFNSAPASGDNGERRKWIRGGSQRSSRHQTGKKSDGKIEIKSLNEVPCLT